MTRFDDDDQLIAGAFADFTDEATPTMRAVGTAPLHTKAIRYRRTRATLISLASALIIALPVATYAALGQQNQGPPVIPGESPTAGIETPTAVPSPSPSDTPPSTPPSQTMTQSAFSVAYFAVAVNNNVEVYAYKDGKATLKATISDPYGNVKATIALSPDETSLAWVEDGGALVVAGVDGLQKRTLVTGIPTAGHSAPMWTADSRRLVTAGGSVDVVSKQMNANKLKGDYQVLAPGNQFTAYATSTGPSRIIVESADGTKTADVPTICANCESNAKSVLALSADGRYVALGGWPSAGERETSWREVLDTRTGQMVLNLERPAGPKPGRFLADGTFVLHDNDKMKVMKIDGTVVTTIPMPDPLKVHTGAPAARYPVLLLVK